MSKELLDAAAKLDRPSRANLVCFANTQLAIRHSIAGDVDKAILTDLLRKSLDFFQHTTAATIELVIDQILDTKDKHELLEALRAQILVAQEAQARANTLADQLTNIIDECIINKEPKP